GAHAGCRVRWEGAADDGRLAARAGRRAQDRERRPRRRIPGRGRDRRRHARAARRRAPRAQRGARSRQGRTRPVRALSSARVDRHQPPPAAARALRVHRQAAGTRGVLPVRGVPERAGAAGRHLDGARRGGGGASRRGRGRRRRRRERARVTQARGRRTARAEFLNPHARSGGMVSVDARDLDDLFRRFAAAADMTALAGCYARVAPELLLVAGHFGAGGAAAEDLVRATFVAAIEHAARYDPARPVLPWLLGILVNQARRERGRRGRAPAADRVPASLPVDPADAAAAAEAAAELADRLRALPAGYREAMVLRFVHGLMPVQIAHTLGVPPGTIKTRLRRGTEMLRRALPTGLATAAATVLVPAR